MPALLALVIALVYSNGLTLGFHFDDWHDLQQNHMTAPPDDAGAEAPGRVTGQVLVVDDALVCKLLETQLKQAGIPRPLDHVRRDRIPPARRRRGRWADIGPGPPAFSASIAKTLYRKLGRYVAEKRANP